LSVRTLGVGVCARAGASVFSIDTARNAPRIAAIACQDLKERLRRRPEWLLGEGISDVPET
jgi:hypothetical protein